MGLIALLTINKIRDTLLSLLMPEDFCSTGCPSLSDKKRYTANGMQVLARAPTMMAKLYKILSWTLRVSLRSLFVFSVPFSSATLVASAVFCI